MGTTDIDRLLIRAAVDAGYGHTALALAETRHGFPYQCRLANPPDADYFRVRRVAYTRRPPSYYGTWRVGRYARVFHLKRATWLMILLYATGPRRRTATRMRSRSRRAHNRLSW